MKHNYFKYSALAFLFNEAVNATLSFSSIGANTDSLAYLWFVILAVLLGVVAIAFLILGFHSKKR
jgi:uncharacterized membrane protein